MAEDNACPFCGASFKESYTDSDGVLTTDFACGTWIDSLTTMRSEYCYETELATLKGIVREMAMAMKPPSGCHPLPRFAGFLNDPEVKKILEEGKDDRG